MRRTKHHVLVILVLALVGLLVACETPMEEPDPGETILEGTWTGTATPDASTVDPGTVSVTLTHVGSVEILSETIYVYIGTATLSGGDIDGSYEADGGYSPGFGTSMTIYGTADSDGDGFDDEFTIDGTVSSDTFTGTYSDFNGSGPWEPMSGSITMSR